MSGVHALCQGSFLRIASRGICWITDLEIGNNKNVESDKTLLNCDCLAIREELLL